MIVEDISKKLAYMEFYTRETEDFHAPIENELEFFECIKRGLIEDVKKKYAPLASKGHGVLSDDKLRNLKYHFVVTVAFATRACVEGGMERETAYNLSDLYIRQADKAIYEEEIVKLHKEAVLDFVTRMSKIPREHIYSKPVIGCYEYVYNNLNRQFTASEMADELGLTPQYLSKLFHKETGETLNHYIAKKRIQTACQMLKYSNYEASDIANFLAYSSHSHFIQCFKKELGITPKQYRNKYYHNTDVIKEGPVTLSDPKPD